MKRFLGTCILILSSMAYSQGKEYDVGVSLNLNPALLGCLLSGGECLSQTGIPFIDNLFGNRKNFDLSDEAVCYNLMEGGWCKDAFYRCRDAKKMVYYQIKKAAGEVPSNAELDKRFHGRDPYDAYMFDEERKHFYEMRRIKKSSVYEEYLFTCTPKQQYHWLKARCGHTRQWRRGMYEWGYGLKFSDTPEYWSHRKTSTCGFKINW